VNALFLPLLAAAATVGPLHTLAPDHWVPFAAVARARRWSVARTTRVTLACGTGHVTVSVALGALGLATGLAMLRELGARMESVAGLLLVGFGLAYALWGLRHAARHELHGEHAPHDHGHAHGHHHSADHVHDPGRLSAWSLFAIFSADPCVAVLPLMLASAPLGWARTLAVVLVYELATLATMVALVLPARAGVDALRLPWLDRYGDAAAGALVAAVGVTVSVLGW
jgi:ABC-type nickel/cobalt efflux system permease component RcnA